MNPHNLRLNINASTLDLPSALGSGVLHQSATSAIEYGCHENVAVDVHGECQISLDFLETESEADRRADLSLSLSASIISPCSSSDSPDSTCSSSLERLMDLSPCSSSASDLPLLSVLLGISQSEEHIIVREHGYKIDREVGPTLQGTLFKAHIIEATKENALYGPVGSAVAIKKVDKAVYANRTAHVDGMTFVVEQDLLKEAILLKHLTLHNRPTGDYIARFVDFFESDTHFYLVTEFVEGLSLEQFVRQAFALMAEGRLSRIDYQKTVKYLFWQLATTTRWLHDVMASCHLDLGLKSVMLCNADFVPETEGSLRVKPHAAISIKLVNFGIAEKFSTQGPTPNHKDFLCDKGSLSLGAPQYRCPSMFDGVAYSAQAADMWSLGMVLFEMMTGTELYTPEDLWDNPRGGYQALHEDRLREYLVEQRLLRFFKRDTFDIVEGLLRVDEERRMTAEGVVQHAWFRSYFKRYSATMRKKHELDALRLERQAASMKHSLPFYQIGM